MRGSYITNESSSCRQYLLRTNRHALIKGSTWPNMMAPTKCHAYLLTTGKVGPVLKPMRTAQPVCQLRAKAPALRKSP